MIKDRAYPIALDVWKDPQGFVIAQHVRDEAWTYFRCWSEAGELADHIGCLHFAGVWHMECTRFSGWKSYPNTSETTLRSYYLQIEPSGLLDHLVAERSAKDPNWRRYDCRHYQHYVVESHDYFIELVAAQVTFTRLEGIQAKPWLDLWARI